MKNVSWKFPMGMWGFAVGIFAELSSIGWFWLIRVKHSFHWLGLSTDLLYGLGLKAV